MAYSKSGISSQGERWFKGYNPSFWSNHWKEEPPIGSFNLKMRSDGTYHLERIFVDAVFVRDFQPSEAEIVCDVLFGTFVWHKCQSLT